MGFKWPSVYKNNGKTFLELRVAYLFLLKSRHRDLEQSQA